MSIFVPVVKNEPSVTLDLAKEHGLTEEEFQRMCKMLGRIPSYTELGVYSVMWSEHCSYKNSISMLKTLPRSGGRLLVAAGEENAGLVDIGDGLAVAFKIESHNHPSAVEPYQGAATGVGGILRDIFSMGARPIAVLNSLRFGELTDPQVRYLFKRIVKGIGDYGNSFGVPTVAGEVYFDACYARNPLVNAMAVGIVEHEKVAKAVAKGKGNSVMIVGSSTGRDGIHGATFASEEISEKSEAKRPAVQVGDPFTEKLLLEATLEAVQTGWVVGIQDMGAAGITCSTSEMSAKGESGMVVDLGKVPLREDGMTGYEIMLSESQERMLFIVTKGYEEDVNKIFKKWDLHAEIIGSVEDEQRLRVFANGVELADVKPSTLVLGGDAPVYTRDSKAPNYLNKVGSFEQSKLGQPDDYVRVFRDLLRAPTIASKRWVTEQYDSMVRTNSVITSEGDAAIVRIKGTSKALAVKTDGNGRYVYLNPRRGAQIAVAESARNVACVGATPVAITNCLNFGNPYDPEIYWQFKEAVKGIGEACRALNTPVTGGNVSFYNESPDGPVFPTPVIGMLGLLDDASKAVGSGFKQAGDLIVHVGRIKDEVQGSEYLYRRVGLDSGDAPSLDLVYEKAVQRTIIDLIGARLVHSAHDVSEGGLSVAVAECVFGARDLGVHVDLPMHAYTRLDGALFGEGQSRIIISLAEEDFKHAQDIAGRNGIEAVEIGTVTSDNRLRITEVLDERKEDLEAAYMNAISELMKGE
ncbi:MAG: phosphoribosylformylglycinamidine synthase II [Ignavibacteria bacterium RIFCSPLOWO2_02_FULL_55_14]|nr:MAG: phosphoribosylformylglycinamidine synthase II [Ignavibacteria bacterium RIFCSPLOWO2_02_FULL_55_14]